MRQQDAELERRRGFEERVIITRTEEGSRLLRRAVE